MALTEIVINEYGTPEAAGICDVCGRAYTVCPPPETAHWQCWTECLEPDCASYDIERDLDIWFEPLAEHGQVHASATPPEGGEQQ